MRRLLNRIELSIRISVIIFIIFCITCLISGALVYCVMKFRIIPQGGVTNYLVIIVMTLVACMIIGTIISTLSSRSILRNVQVFIEATNKVANGDFSVRLPHMHAPEFKILAENFNRMAEELGSIEILSSDFINNFSHEFKTPIVSIKGFAEILKSPTLTEAERNEYLDIVIEESKRLTTLATNVLNFTKIEQQTILRNRQDFNVGEQLRQCILLLEKKILEKEIALQIDLQDIQITANKEMLSQVWINLLDNAIKFTDKKGLITIHMQPKEDKLIVMIRDNGCGISEDALPRIYDKFYQQDQCHQTKGNGLGLAMVKKIIDLHEGKIACESIPDKGTTFHISLPIKA